MEWAPVTDVDSALQAALRELASSIQRTRLLLLLSDGEANHGVSEGAAILGRAAEAAPPGLALHAVAFGENADYPLLVRLTEAHHGLARKVYPDADAALQLQACPIAPHFPSQTPRLKG